MLIQGLRWLDLFSKTSNNKQQSSLELSKEESSREQGTANNTVIQYADL